MVSSFSLSLAVFLCTNSPTHRLKLPNSARQTRNSRNAKRSSAESLTLLSQRPRNSSHQSRQFGSVGVSLPHEINDPYTIPNTFTQSYLASLFSVVSCSNSSGYSSARSIRDGLKEEGVMEHTGLVYRRGVFVLIAFVHYTAAAGDYRQGKDTLVWRIDVSSFVGWGHIHFHAFLQFHQKNHSILKIIYNDSQTGIMNFTCQSTTPRALSFFPLLHSSFSSRC